MDSLQKQARALLAEVAVSIDKLGIDALHDELQNLEAVSQKTDFWEDNRSAQETMKQIAKLQERVLPWLKLRTDIQDVLELSEEGDRELASDLQNQLQASSESFELLKGQLKFAGPYDDHSVIMYIFAGAGGTDAQDWAQMLLRMYIRWAEKHKLDVKMVGESAGDEAGIKSAVLEIDGPFVFGQLKGEHGVHRLVRLSPFNSDNLRQTSFAKVDILPKIDKPHDVEIDEKDLKIDVFRSGGHGGQSVNTTDSAVRVTHLPTNIVVVIQNERSQLQNKETALTILRSRLAALRLEQHKDKISEIKGPNEQAAWGNQIRSYVLHPYKQVKDLRTKHESSNPDSVLDGDIDEFINAYLDN